jgi:hypothetical protein
MWLAAPGTFFVDLAMLTTITAVRIHDVTLPTAVRESNPVKQVRGQSCKQTIRNRTRTKSFDFVPDLTHRAEEAIQ